MNNFLLDFLAIGAIFSGILVITSKNPVISVLFLISVFVNVAGYLILLGVGFIGISYLIVYVGAIAILFLFVVMMLNLQIAELSSIGSEYTQNIPLGTIIRSLFIFELLSLLPVSIENRQSFLYGYTSIFDMNAIPSYIVDRNQNSVNNIYHGETRRSMQIQVGGADMNAELGILNWLNSKFVAILSYIIPNNNNLIFANVESVYVNNHTMNRGEFITSSHVYSVHADDVNTIQLSNDIHVRLYSNLHFSNFIQIQSIGYMLYTNNRFWLLLTSVILLLAMIGPITLSINNKTR